MVALWKPLPTHMTVEEFLHWDADVSPIAAGSSWMANRC
jgi:hypothetical protein